MTAFNPFHPDFPLAAYSVYADCRQHTPVLPVQGCIGRDWVLFRYRDIQRVLTDRRAVVDDLPARIALAARGGDADVGTLCRMLERWLFFVNPPEHTRLRTALDAHFSRAAVERLRAHTRATVERLIEPALDAGRIDVIRDVAAPLPCLVAAAVLGVPLADVGQAVEWSTGLFRVFTQPMPLAEYRRLNGLTQAFYAWIQDEWRRRRAEPGLLDRLVAECDAGRLEREDACAFAAMLFGVGQETTEHLIGNAMFALSRHPRQRAELEERPELMTAAVTELARYDTPVQMIVRRAAEEFAIGDAQIRAGERLHLMLGSAHHDEEIFPDPDRLDFARPNAGRLIFGSGIHKCLGSHLALLVAGTAVEVMLSRLAGLTPADPAPPRIRSAHMRGFASLACTFVAAPHARVS